MKKKISNDKNKKGLLKQCNKEKQNRKIINKKTNKGNS